MKKMKRKCKNCKMAPRSYYRGCKSLRNFDYREVMEFRKINEPRDYSHPSSGRTGRIHRVRSRNKKLNIPKLVYKFLGNVASLESGNHEEKSARSRSLKRGPTKGRKKQKQRPDTVHVATKSANESRTSVSTSRSVDTNSTICTAPSTPASTSSGIQTAQKFSIQAIKDYIRAGIAEGKRRAKKYMCKALSFGVDTGYLIPTDSDGQVLRVSAALGCFSAQNDNSKKGDRGIRQKLRKGDVTCTSEERKLLRRRVPPVPQKRPRSPSSAGSSTSSTERPGKSRTKKPKYGRWIKQHKGRGPKKAKFKRGPGRPRKANCGETEIDRLGPALSSDNWKDNISEGREESFNEEQLTPSRSEEDNAKSIKKESSSDPSIEDDSSERRDQGKEK